MPSNTNSPSIEQAYLQTFENNFMQLAQQSESKLLSSPGVSMMPVKGFSHISRIGKTELDDITGQRNPQINPESMDNDNRKANMHRYAKQFIVDNYDAAIQLITDPTSSLFETLRRAKNRTADRLVVNTAVGSVLIGRPDREPTSLSAANDGVITVAGTTNFDYENVITVLERNFANNEIDAPSIDLAVSANEEYLLKQETKFISQDYTAYRPVDSGKVEKAGSFNVIRFAGSKTGVTTINNPILPESGGTRKCVALAPDAIGFGMEIADFDVFKGKGIYVNSWIIAIEVYFKAIRKEGVRVQIVTATV